MLLRPLDVIYAFDAMIRPPGPKYWVCVAPDAGLFFRINTKGDRRGSVALPFRDHPFMKWDCFIECGRALEADDYLIEEAVRQRGILGAVSRRLVPAILAAVEASDDIAPDSATLIRAALSPLR